MWTEARVRTLENLFRDGHFAPLQEECNLPVSHFLAHGRLLAELGRLWGIIDSKLEQHPLVHTLHIMGNGRRLIAWFARALAHATLDPLQVTRQCWKRDIGRDLTSKEWEKALHYPRKVFRNAKF
ncbi:hypothetical protein NDU88_002674 [Pleurodeles waltl]|uniref:Uncharacterized protein n=1 Tax=Pleurodeles waltl TaxID=8319 RepID=A0AAV7Q6Q3_PLEWA|nr:hypothetical protein NDU88_002674 [Pleurodeles waltl]